MKTLGSVVPRALWLSLSQPTIPYADASLVQRLGLLVTEQGSLGAQEWGLVGGSSAAQRQGSFPLPGWLVLARWAVQAPVSRASSHCCTPLPQELCAGSMSPQVC